MNLCSSRERQIGTTTEQIKNAPKNALYIWPNSKIGYAKKLARDLGREDLEIRSLSSTSVNDLRGRYKLEVVFDHSIFDYPNTFNWGHISELLEIIRHYKEPNSSNDPTRRHNHER